MKVNAHWCVPSVEHCDDITVHMHQILQPCSENGVQVVGVALAQPELIICQGGVINGKMSSY